MNLKGWMKMEIVILEYSERQKSFHYNLDLNDNIERASWVKLEKMPLVDAESFCDFMDKKYCKGKHNAQFPPLDIIKLELSLFIKLKAYHRKLKY